MAKEKQYLNVNTDEVLTETQFRELAWNYINSNTWEDGNKPSVSEVMDNMDFIMKIPESEE